MPPSIIRHSESTAWRWARWGTLAIVVCLAARLLFKVSELQTASGMLRVLARDATIGWIGLGHRPIDQEKAAQQAEFWVAETKRVFDAHPSSSLARGAAWILDSPGHGFYFRHLRPGSIPQVPIELDQKAVDAETLQFMSATKLRCLEFSQLATQLSPDNVDAWRTRATLAFDMHGKPRDDDWSDVLATARARDPNNALYDYLQANHLWQQNVTFSVDGIGTLADPAILQQCQDHFARGQQKSYFPATLADWQVILRFLKHTGVPRHEFPGILNSRQLHTSSDLLVINLVRMQLDLGERQSPLDLLARIQASARLTEQVASAGDLSGIGVAMNINSSLVAKLDDLLAQHRSDLDSAAVTSAEELRTALARQNLVWETANGRLPPMSTAPSYSAWNHVLQITCKAALESFVLLAGLGTLCWLFTRRAAHEGTPSLGFVAHLACWVLAFAIAVPVLGWGASHVHDLPSQSLFARRLMIAVVAISMSIVVLVGLFLNGWRFSLRQLFIGPLLLGGAIAILGLLGAPLIGDINPAVLQAAAPSFAPGTFAWGLIQFTTYAGPTVFVLLALMLIGLLALQRATGQPDSSGPRDLKTIVRRVVREIGRSAAIASVIALMLFLLVAPGALQAIENEYDAKLAWLTGLEGRRDQMAEQIRAIESNPAEMANLQQQAAQHQESEAP